MRKRLVFFCVLLALVAFGAVAQEAAPAAAPAAAAAQAPGTSPWRYLAAALAVGIACIAGGIAVGQIGAAAMGAMAENPELAGKALPYAGLAEGICLWGFLVGLLILLL
ncbi:MAG: ATPase [Spirochaetaceae bacterium]|nr:ATPase [Spirochaetaceae bacterium]